MPLDHASGPVDRNGMQDEAQERARAVVEAAHDRAGTIVEEARHEARRILAEAHLQATAVLEEATRAAQVMTLEGGARLANLILDTHTRLGGVEQTVSTVVQEFVRAMKAVEQAMPRQEGLGAVVRDLVDAFKQQPRSP